MDTARRVELAARHTSEVLTPDELTALFERESHPRAYIGFEPSGALHVGHLVTAAKMRDLVEAGCQLTVFLADWHAWINDKLGGSMERITDAGRRMAATFEALGVAGPQVTVRWAHELVGAAGYWDRVVRVAKATSVARTRRAMSVLGRGEDESALDTAKLLYPSMQAADVFELPVDLAYAGNDQRRAHVLAREVAHHYGWPVPVALHTPLISSLKGGGRMDPAEGTVERKMAKSDPSAGIVLTAPGAEIAERLAGAFCPAKEVDGNPVIELVRFVVFPWEGRFAIDRPAKFGGPLAFEDEPGFTEAWRSGTVHPKDVKAALAVALERIAAPVARHPELGPAPG